MWLMDRMRYGKDQNRIDTPQDQYRKAPEIRINQIGKTIKQNYISHWKTQTKTQSKMQFYLALNRNYTLAPYLTLITDKNLRTTLTKYRLPVYTMGKRIYFHAFWPFIYTKTEVLSWKTIISKNSGQSGDFCKIGSASCV